MIQTYSIQKKLKSIGVEGYIGKGVNSDKLIDYIHEVLNGSTVYELKEEDIVTSSFTTPQTAIYNLSDREKEILGFIKEGYSTKKIAASIHLSEFTVETHRKNIFRKTGVKSLAELIVLANKI